MVQRIFGVPDKKHTLETPQLIITARLLDLLRVPLIDHRLEEDDVSFLHSVSSYPPLCPILKAKALYMLGMNALSDARNSGDLQRLWRNEELSKGSRHLAEGYKYFDAAVQLHGDACDMEKRNALRCLALCRGPTTSYSNGSWEALNASIGISFTRSLKLRQKLRPFMEDSLVETLHRLPSCWRFVSIALCPTGDMLLSSIENRGSELTCRITCIVSDSSSAVFSDVLDPLGDILIRNHNSLNTLDPEEFRGSNDKRKWWSSRRAIDSDMSALLQDANSRYFEDPIVAEVLLGQNSSNEIVGNLNAKFESACATESANFSKMNVSDLRTLLVDSGMDVGSVNSMKKPDLVKLAESEKKQIDTLRSSSHEGPGHCTLLCLDETLQQFPFEGLPCLEGRAVCRIPSFSYLLSRLNEQPSFPIVHPGNVSYIIDPEANLGGTRARMDDLVSSLSTQWGEGEWGGYTAESPSLDFVEESIKVENGLVMYFGHGGAQHIIGRSRLESDDLVVKSSMFLMGCSSGKLQSPNMSGSAAIHNIPLFYEPEGIALSYLLAGSPCVVGNLWDVTDRDIDRFTESFLRSFFSKGHPSVAKCISSARGACKLRGVVGCAPVCYGLPTVLLVESVID